MPKIALAVDRRDEALMRRAEQFVNDLWGRWTTTTFAAESNLSVMARVAFQFAVLYLKGERDREELKALNGRLDELLKNLPGLDSTP